MHKTEIVAEIGINHNGDMDVANRLIQIANENGADYVKFQLWHKKTFPDLEKYRLEIEQLKELIVFCNQLNQNWFCTAFDEPSIKILQRFGMETWKIPSNDAVIDNQSVMGAFMAASRGKRKIISTGRFKTISDIYSFTGNMMRLRDEHNCVFLHCVSEYPLKPENANLTRITELRERYNHIGCSDHSGLPEIPIAAVVLGAEMIEVHITLSKKADGPDHKASLEPKEFEYMIKAIRNIEVAL